MNSVEQTALLLEQVGNQIRFVEGFSFETRMQLSSMTNLLLLMFSAASNTGLWVASKAGML